MKYINHYAQLAKRSYFFVSLSLLLSAPATAQTWTTVWGENFNNKTLESCYSSQGSAYWSYCNSGGPRNSMINGSWEVLNTNLGSTQNPNNASGGRFLMYWTDNSYSSKVPDAENIIFSKTLTGLTIGKKYRISYAYGGLLMLPSTTLSSPAMIGLNLNSTTVVAPVQTTTSWQTATYTWTATATSMTLDWTNSVKAVAGDDFAMDNLLVEVAGNPLPVTLNSFSATPSGCSIQLQWETSVETDFNHFEIERSNNGADFTTLATIAAKGSGSSYSYSDRQPSGNKNLYRLKLVNSNGSNEYSATVTGVADCRTQQEVQIYPVPAHDQLTLTGLQANDQVSVYDAYGRALVLKTAQAQQEQISLSNLAAGIYTLRVQSAGGIHTRQIVKE